MSTRLLVADSGPLIALARLELLLLPSRLYAEGLVTETVWDEVTRAPRPSELAVLLAAQKDGLFNVVADPATMAFELNGLQLCAGEQTESSIALLRQGDVLVDERRGRSAAVALHLPVIGTLGVLVRARRTGMIGPVRPLTDKLLAGGYFLADRLVEQALAALGE